jgi:site-specific DNA-cytosine methylase
MSLPRNTFARRIINLKGYTTEEEITEVAYADKVSREEAARRIKEDLEQSGRRSAAQWLRHTRAKNKVASARQRILAIAHHEGRFLCAERLEDIAFDANWRSPPGGFSQSYWDTGRVFRELCRPMEKAGLLAELRDPEEDRFIGYTITDAGRKELLGE